MHSVLRVLAEVALGALQAMEGEELAPGTRLTGEITGEEERVHTETIDSTYFTAPTVGRELRRAFELAGARTVSSLWSVEDTTTAELMGEFYVNLLRERMGALQALRRAQLSMIERNRLSSGSASPAGWGAFVIGGDWR